MTIPFAKVNFIPVPTQTKTIGILALTKWKTFYKPVILQFYQYDLLKIRILSHENLSV